MLRIVIGGDICPQGNIESAFKAGAVHDIFHDLLDEITSTDLSIVNLECPLISHPTPITKPGTILGADVQCINGFAAAKWRILNLANNHSFDHGTIGLKETIKTIKDAGLKVVGAGMNMGEAQEPIIQTINGQRIVIYAMAEHEFSVAGQKMPGANPLDLINFINAVQSYKQNGIFIVLIHGGKEHYPYPSPEMVRRCRFMVNMGADAVICSHTHCPLPWEIYSDRPIVYGMGNLVFEPCHGSLTTWHEGYLARLTIEDGRVHFEAIPYFQSQTITGAQKMDENARTRFFDEMAKKSTQVKDDIFLEAHWVKYCQQQKVSYLSGLFGYSKPMRKLRKLLLPFLHPKEEMLRALLLTQCETHQEILKGIFKIECSGNKDIDGGDHLL